MNNFSNNAPSRVTKAAIVVITLVQGCLLLTLHKLLENKLWPTGDPTGLYLLFTLAVVIPLTLAIVLREPRDKWPWLLVLGYGGLLALLAAYSGYQCEPASGRGCENVTLGFVFTIGIACFIALFFIQTWLEKRDKQFPYTLLFNYSWQNYLTLKLAALFVGIFWGILLLWAALFDVLGIVFFKELFKTVWFIYPVTGFMAGLGIVIFRFQVNAVGTVRSILAALMRMLLPLLAFVSLLFLFTLPFTGLAPLWKTGYGTTLLLWLIALVLFFTNSVYQDGAGERPYGLVLHRVIQVALVAQVVFVGCCFYGLVLRINQYGWTVDRLWGFSITLILSGFILTYAISIIKKQDHWLDWLKAANKGMALFIIVICLLVNSPLLDFRKISVASQLSRLDMGEVTLEEFDYKYFARELARPGHMALQRLKDSGVLKNHPAIIADIDVILASGEENADRSEWKKRDNLLEYLRIYPQQVMPPEKLLDLVYEKLKEGDQCIGTDSNCYLVELDINDAPGLEYILIISWERWANTYIYGKDKGEWILTTGGSGGIRLPNDWNDATIRAALEKGDFRAVPSQWKDFYIGDKRLYVR